MPLCFAAMPAVFIFCYVLAFLITAYFLRRGIIPGLLALYDLLFHCFKKEELGFIGMSEHCSAYASFLKGECLNPSLFYRELSFSKPEGRVLSLLNSREEMLRRNATYSVTYAVHSKIIITIAAVDDDKVEKPKSMPRTAKPLPADNCVLNKKL